ncbi:DUF3221 domain-containing protein [Alkalihalophilus marmarensis]|uniref:DUF3221 domain-containing protein n=1 Tax=Alkalihalophilus marmarensis DSM 21297 TaxID=1188261 RepID=U6SKF6_9BACI|nr:DUF3221 domain-containing protein [Alkalihalophilus marmarensis]ERN51837.1 hypothetical protein A33I_18675 [Alkalihalophilus marmarensis DSM 21297]
MKRTIYWLLAAFILIIVSYTLYDKVINPPYKGTVVQIDGNNMLVAADTEIQIEGESSKDEVQSYMNDSIWFSTSEDQIANVKVGDKVKVSSGDYVETSLPPRMDAIKVKKLR